MKTNIMKKIERSDMFYDVDEDLEFPFFDEEGIFQGIIPRGKKRFRAG